MVDKPIHLFSKHPATKDRLRSKCKSCRRKEGRDRYKERREYLNEQNRVWALNNKEYFSEYFHLHRYERNAQAKVSYAVSVGNLIRPSKCSWCNIKCKPEAHHDNYDEPLNVTWLCKPCHAELHVLERKHREIEQTSNSG